MNHRTSGSWLKATVWLVGLGMITIVAAAAAAHVVMTSAQDRQRVMDQLKITLFPSGPGAYLASTYDESTANPSERRQRSGHEFGRVHHDDACR
jgi:hypothetical protein